MKINYIISTRGFLLLIVTCSNVFLHLFNKILKKNRIIYFSENKLL